MSMAKSSKKNNRDIPVSKLSPFLIDIFNRLMESMRLDRVLQYTSYTVPWGNNRHLGTPSLVSPVKYGPYATTTTTVVKTSLKKKSFKLNRVYLDPLNMSNTGDFSWSWILNDFIQAQKEEGKFVVVCPRPS